MSRPAPIHICFYSTRCEWSKKFIETLKTTPYLNEFKFICVDPSPSRPALPSWLKQTPTLVVQDQEGKQQRLTDNDVLNWIYEQNIKRKGNTNGKEKDGLLESFIDMNMGNQLGDSYSFIDDNVNSESLMMHNFTYLNGRDSNGPNESFPMNQQQPVRKVSKKEELFNSQLDQYKAARDVGMPQPIMRQY